jgi:hypothetical protein
VKSGLTTNFRLSREPGVGERLKRMRGLHAGNAKLKRMHTDLVFGNAAIRHVPS